MVDLTTVQIIVRDKKQTEFLKHVFLKQGGISYKADIILEGRKKCFRFNKEYNGRLNVNFTSIEEDGTFNVKYIMPSRRHFYNNVKEFDEVFHNDFIKWERRHNG